MIFSKSAKLLNLAIFCILIFSLKLSKSAKHFNLVNFDIEIFSWKFTKSVKVQTLRIFF